MANERFSHRLRDLISGSRPKTLQNLIDHFAEKSFAVMFLLLMAIPALPLPTGGITHIFEIIVMLLAFELIVGRRSIWLPEKWRKLELPKKVQASTLPKLIKLIQKVEKYSRPRLKDFINHSISNKIIGLVVLVLALSAFLAPPFSGLDTLPSLSIVLISLAIILDDIVVAIIGVIMGVVGIGLLFALGSLVFKLV